MPIVTCDYCSKDVTVTAARLKNLTICCSRECAAALKKSMQQSNVTCYICNKPFYIKPSHLANRKFPEKVTCSMECNKERQKETMLGEGNHQHGLKGELNSSYQSDIVVNTSGYLCARAFTHPKCNKNGYVLLHRLLMEEYLKGSNDYCNLINIEGTFVLKENLVIHHINGNKSDNTLSNLEVLSLENHSKLHAYDRLESDGGWYGKISTGILSKSSKLDAGLDVTASETTVIHAGTSRLIGTGLHITVPKNHVGLLWSRSGLSVKYNLEVGAGCIDHGYTGEVKVHLYNHGNSSYKVNKGDRIAQLLTVPINIEDYKKVNSLETSSRGDKGFGSSGR